MAKVENTASVSCSINKSLEIITLFVISALIHAAVLAFIFPGYYEPLWPLHSDFYLPADISNSGLGLLTYLNYPRPSGMAFFFIIGNLGIHGSIAAIILVTLLNTVITAKIAQSMLNINLNLQFITVYIIYLFLLFSHPYFYSFYAHDAFSQLSYLLLTIGVLVFSSLFRTSLKLATAIFFTLSLLAFLAKETFGATALGIALIWFIYHQKNSKSEAIAPFASVLIALTLTFVFNFSIKSSFVTNTSDAYKVDLNPISVLTTWFDYVSLGYNPASCIGLILIGILVCYKSFTKKKAATFFYITCILGFAASLLPNSLLASHEHRGYSWTGAYLSFAIIFLLAAPEVKSKWGRKQFLFFASIIFAAVLFNQAANTKKYSSDENQWFLIQEETQKNLLISIETLTKNLDPKEEEKILITGVSFPYSPFRHANALNDFLSKYNAKIDVISYSLNTPVTKRSNYVSEIPVSAEIDISKYTRIWLFGNDGKFIYSLNNENADRLFPLKNYILFPEVATALKIKYLSFSHEDELTDGYRLLNAGNAYLIYQQVDLATDAYKRSLALIPENPFPWYMTGMQLEKQNKFEDAIIYFKKAVELDPGNLNSNFKSALLRVEKKRIEY